MLSGAESRYRLGIRFAARDASTLTKLSYFRSQEMIATKNRPLRTRRLFGNRIANKARRVLEESPIFRGRSNLIRIDEKQGCLVLEGRLPTYYLKQQLQTLLREVEGVDQIDNRVCVDWPVEST